MKNLQHFARDQNGSRQIQIIFENGTPEKQGKIFDALKPMLIDLITHPFGNFVVQKFLEFGQNSQREVIFNTIKGNIKMLSIDPFGCRVIQRCVECFVKDDGKIQVILNSLQNDLRQLITHRNANHVLQKIFTSVNSKMLDAMYKVVTDNAP